MKENDNEFLKNLNREYISEAWKFVNALKDNASPKDLITIRDKAKQLLYRLRNTSKAENPGEKGTVNTQL